MIVLDTTILVYAVGSDPALGEPCRRLLTAVGDGRVRASTTPEVIQEFVHVRARRTDRTNASSLGRAYAEALAPLLVVEQQDLLAGLRLFERYRRLGAFDAVLCAAATRHGAEALVSADRAFAAVREVRHVDPTSAEIDRLLA